MKNLLYILFFAATFAIFADDHRMGPEMKQKMWMAAKIKLDLAEMKGPRSVAEVKEMRENRLADLELLINSGKYKAEQLARLEGARDRLMSMELPTQEMLNERHQALVKRAKQRMKNNAQMRNGMDRERQKRWMRQRELREDRALKNKRRKY